jgi:eukaryotic-like serine/threonine-protein kinase
MGETNNVCKIYMFILISFFCFSYDGLAAVDLNNSQDSSSVSEKWKFKTGGNVNGIPLIDNGVVYVGSFDGNFYAIDASTGTEKWHYKTDNKIFTNPVLYNGIICFESGNSLYALNTNGELVWKFILCSEAVINMNDEWDYYRSSPSVSNGVVYIGSEKGKVFGINIADGSKAFECQTAEGKYAIKTTPLIYDGKIYFGDWNGVFFAYDLSTATMVWKYDTKIDYTSTSWVNAIVTDPVFYKGSIYFGGRSCNLYCVNPQTGAKIWMYHESESMWMLGGPTIVDDVVYMGSSYQHVVYTFNALSGSKGWKKSVTYRVNGKPLIDGDYVFVGTEADTDTTTGTLCALNKTDGSMKAKLRLGGQVYSSPVLYNGVIYFGCSNGYVYAYDKDAFINMKYPNTYLKETSKLDLGTLELKGSFKKTFYVYNDGEVRDSVGITETPSKILAFNPSSFLLEPKDSQEVEFSIDLTTLAEKTYTCAIKVNSYNALVPFSISRTLTFKAIKSTGVSDEDRISDKYFLSQNYPNPFNPTTTFSYSIPSSQFVNITVFDICGKEIECLVNEEKSPGNYKVEFNGKNLSSGIYFYTIQTGQFNETKKFILMK